MLHQNCEKVTPNKNQSFSHGIEESLMLHGVGLILHAWCHCTHRQCNPYGPKILKGDLGRSKVHMVHHIWCWVHKTTCFIIFLTSKNPKTDSSLWLGSWTMCPKQWVSIGTPLSSIIELPYPLRGQKDWNSLIFPFMKWKSPPVGYRL